MELPLGRRLTLQLKIIVVQTERLCIVIEELICRLSNVEKRIQLLQENEVELDTKASFAFRFTDQHITNLANLSSSFSKAARTVPDSPQSKLSATSSPSNPSSSRAKNIHKMTSNSIEFKPNKCIVICNIPKEKIVTINQDIVRKELNEQFGPLMIDIVNIYKFFQRNSEIYCSVCRGRSYSFNY